MPSDYKKIYISEIYIKNASRIHSRQNQKGTFLIFGQPYCILLLLYLVCGAGFGVGGHFVEGVGVVGCVGFVTGVVVVRVSGGVA